MSLEHVKQFVQWYVRSFMLTRIDPYYNLRLAPVRENNGGTTYLWSNNYLLRG